MPASIYARVSIQDADDRSHDTGHNDDDVNDDNDDDAAPATVSCMSTCVCIANQVPFRNR